MDVSTEGAATVAATGRPDGAAPAHAAGEAADRRPADDVVFDIAELNVHYGDFRAVRDASLQVRKGEITAFIGPSGCGKTTVLRCLNRMNDLIEIARRRPLR